MWTIYSARGTDSIFKKTFKKRCKFKIFVHLHSIMAKLSALLSDLAAKSGIDINSDVFKTLLKNQSIESIDVPDEVAKPLQENLFTLEAAKNNSMISAHFKATHMNGLDAEQDRVMSELGFDEATINELRTEKSSYKRVGMLAKKVKDLTAKQFDGKAGDKAELLKELNEAKAQIAKVVADSKHEVDTIRAAHQNELLNYDIAGHLAGYNYALPKEMPVEIKTKTALSVLNSELQVKGLKVSKVDGVLRLQKLDGTDYYDSAHKKVEFSDFAKQVLDTNKLLANSAPTNGASGGNSKIITPAADGQKVNPALADAAKQSLADIGLQ